MKQVVHLVLRRLYFVARWLFFPGLDLHTRCRYRRLPTFFRRGPIRTLDAGCGNGHLAFAAHRLGNKVLAVDIDAKQIARNQEYYHWLGCDGIEFAVWNIYDLRKLGCKFDQIICSETLEHLARDAEVIAIFADILRENGVLHLCSPYALHPHHHLGRTSGPEDGGHVRDGYTLASYKALLEPAGFTIVCFLGVGSSLLYRADRVIRWVRNRFGDLCAAPLFLIFGWLVSIIDDRLDPKIPFSLYVQAIKVGKGSAQEMDF